MSFQGLCSVQSTTLTGGNAFYHKSQLHIVLLMCLFIFNKHGIKLLYYFILGISNLNKQKSNRENQPHSNAGFYGSLSIFAESRWPIAPSQLIRNSKQSLFLSGQAPTCPATITPACLTLDTMAPAHSLTVDPSLTNLNRMNQQGQIVPFHQEQ